MTSRMTTKTRSGAYVCAVVLAVVSCGGSDTAGPGQVDEYGNANGA
jgi:hypothetical protein